jgi:hypothetical protein
MNAAPAEAIPLRDLETGAPDAGHAVRFARRRWD